MIFKFIIKLILRFLGVFVLLMFYSCATIVNSEQVKIKVHTLPDSATIILDNDSCVQSPVILEVPRSYDDFNLIVKNDSIQKEVRVRSIVSPEFKWGNLLFLYGSPLAYFIDASAREKIYSYDNSILIELNEENKEYSKYKSSKKGNYYLRGSIPWFDFVEFDNGRGYEHYDTYLGLTLGFDYYILKRSYLSISGGLTGISDIGYPVMDREYGNDTLEHVTTFFAKITNNHDFQIISSEHIGFSIGYGLNLARFKYREVANDTINLKDVELYKSSKTTLGYCLNASMYLFKYLHVGLTFSRSLYNINSGKSDDSYLSYIDFGLRIPLREIKQRQYKTIKYKPKLCE